MVTKMSLFTNRGISTLVALALQLDKCHVALILVRYMSVAQIWITLIRFKVFFAGIAR
jgi:hypothetical protein